MSEAKKELWFLFGYSLFIIGVYVFRPGGENYSLIVKGLSYLTSVIALLFGWRSLRYFGYKSDQGKIVLAIMGMVFLWLVGDIGWDLSGDAVVSLADIPYFVGYAFLAFGIIKGITLIDKEFFKKRAWILSICSLVLLIVYFKFFPLSWDNEVSIAQNIGTAGYILVDSIMLILSAIILVLLLSGSYSHAWLAIALASIFFFVSDVIYTVQYETYASGDIIDLGWVLGYVLYAAAFVLLQKNAQQIVASVQQRVKSRDKKKG